MLKTRITELFGIKHPVIQGGMQWVGYAELVSAVSNAGALGILTALTQPTPEALTKEIERTREMTDQPFGVNLTVLPTISPPPYEEYAQAIVGAGIKIVETAGRSPEPYMELFKEYDVKVIHKCTSVRHALKAQSVGVSAITIDGFECAGHPGEDDIPSLVLLPQAAEALDIPVAGCGGFSDAKSLVAALALGGEAIVMGTRFMATKEAGIHQNVKDRMTEADERSTNLMFRTLHNTARVFKNSISDQVVEIESTGTATFEDVKDLVAGQRGRVVFEKGDMEHGIWSAGISVARVKDIPTCKEMVSRLVSDAEDIIDGRLQQVKAS
jgi:nitronate monooxygenase|tara:strand:+ start:876 stop:1853 length:978 start_codon:yes stop_codon:yes gene_type:complete